MIFNIVLGGDVGGQNAFLKDIAAFVSNFSSKTQIMRNITLVSKDFKFRALGQGDKTSASRTLP